jgi:predicted PurR-regulated permease PerM
MPDSQSWTRARDIGLAVLVWLAIAYVIFSALGHVARALLMLAFAALLAYALSPGVALLSRLLPRWLAVTIMYVASLALLGTLGYIIVSTSASQLATLAKSLPTLLKQDSPTNPSPIAQLLAPLGVSSDQFNTGRDQVIGYAEGLAGQIATQVVPILTSVASAVLDIVLVFVISIYLVTDGSRAVRWLRAAAPARQRGRVGFFLDVLQHTVGGYIRGQLFMSALIGVLVGGGMFAFQVPYALLLGVLAFVLEFIPILGTLVSGAICVLVALPTRGWIWALVVLGYFVIVHVIEGDVVGPRVMGRVLGLHPVVAIIALVIGGELFGIWGALFAAPVAGVIQAVLVAAWAEWRETHLDQFPSAGGGERKPESLVAAPLEHEAGRP